MTTAVTTNRCHHYCQKTARYIWAVGVMAVVPSSLWKTTRGPSRRVLCHRVASTYLFTWLISGNWPSLLCLADYLFVQHPRPTSLTFIA